MKKINSPYTSITGCTFAYYEFKRCLPLLMSDDAEKLIKDEVENNRLMQVNSQTSRYRFALEFKRRYASVPPYFWVEWQNWSESGQRIGLFYAILKTYKIVFDFHFNVTVKKWICADNILNQGDIEMEMNEIASRDAFVNSWSDATKKKSISCYLTMLRDSGLLEGKSNILLHVNLDISEWAYYFRSGDLWFLDGCLLYAYEIDNIKSQLQ